MQGAENEGHETSQSDRLSASLITLHMERNPDGSLPLFKCALPSLRRLARARAHQ